MKHVFGLIFAYLVKMTFIGRDSGIGVFWFSCRKSNQQFFFVVEKQQSNGGKRSVNAIFVELVQEAGYHGTHAQKIVALIIQFQHIPNSPVYFKIE